MLSLRFGSKLPHGIYGSITLHHYANFTNLLPHFSVSFRHSITRAKLAVGFVILLPFRLSLLYPCKDANLNQLGPEPEA